MIGVDDALHRIAEHITSLDAEEVELGEALGRVTASAARSDIDLPPFAQSAMDGYALRSADTVGADADAPRTLSVVGEVRAGPVDALPQVDPEQAVRIFTGAAVPPGADAVVRQERVRRDGESIVVHAAIDPGNDIRPVGEELARSTQLVSSGTRLDERHLAALSMTGYADVHVRKRPRVALLVSGDEVVEPGRRLEAGEIYDANSPFVVGLLRRTRHIQPDIIKLRDDVDETRRTLDEALTSYDAVVSTGGVSVGDYDFLTTVASEVGAEQIFWKIRQKPGKPVFFAMRDRTPFLGLPGNPGAVFVGAHAYLARVLDRLEGIARVAPNFRRGRLDEPIAKASSRARWAPCRLEIGDDGVVELLPIDGGRAHRMSQLYQADALVLVDEGDGALDAGEIVRWVPVGP